MNKNFKLIKKEKIKDIDSIYNEFEYTPLKTKIVWIQNKDQDRAFTIGFRTKACDDTGVSHILEHSVLRGSRKYPFKRDEVMAELIKKSSFTYLNAITYPDRTIYPFSSNIETEFLKILDVYLDAVFFPRVLEDKKFFQQEGWRYDLDENGKIVFNGVVFNEMKGAYSNIDWNIFSYVVRNLLKDSDYYFDFAGDPKEIVKLKYEDLVKHHKKYYHPSNSIIYFYGDLDIDSIFEYLEKEFLSFFKKEKINSKIKLQKKTDQETRKKIKFFSPNEQGSSILNLSFLFDKNNSLEKNIEFLFLNNLLFREDISLLKSKLLATKLVKKIDSDMEFDLGQVLLIMNLKGVDPKNFSKLEKVFWNGLEEILQSDLSQERINAFLNSVEFSLKSKNLQTGLGLMYGRKVIESWNHNLKNLDDNLKSVEAFEKIKEKLRDQKYIKKLIKKYFANNKNRLILQLKADSKIDTEKELNKEIEKINKKKDKAVILQQIQEFKDWEKTKESEENLSLIKGVATNEFPKEIKNFDYKVVDRKYLFSKIDSKDIEQFVLSFDISHLNENDLSYLQLLFSYIGKFDFETNKMSKEEVVVNRMKYFGNLTFQINHFQNKQKKLLSKVNINFTILKENKKQAFEFLNEILENVIFDKSKIEAIQKNLLVSYEDWFSGYSRYFTELEMLSKASEDWYLKDYYDGVKFFEFLKKENFEGTIKRIQNLYEKVFIKNGLIISHSAKKEMKVDNIFSLLKIKEIKYKINKNNFQTKNESVGYVYDKLTVSSNTLLWKIDNFPKEFADIISDYASFAYLWPKVREEGGAYGSYLNFIKELNSFIFVSYDDSQIQRTYDTYSLLPEFLKDIKMSKEQIDSLIAKELSEYLKPMSQLSFANHYLFYELKGWKDREKTYQKTFKFKVQEFAKLAENLEKNKDNFVIKATFGNKNNIEKAKNNFDRIEKI